MLSAGGAERFEGFLLLWDDLEDFGASKRWVAEMSAAEGPQAEELAALNPELPEEPAALPLSAILIN